MKFWSLFMDIHLDTFFCHLASKFTYIILWLWTINMIIYDAVCGRNIPYLLYLCVMYVSILKINSVDLLYLITWSMELRNKYAKLLEVVTTYMFYLWHLSFFLQKCCHLFCTSLQGAHSHVDKGKKCQK